jgi:hypothetical protein
MMDKQTVEAAIIRGCEEKQKSLLRKSQKILEALNAKMAENDGDEATVSINGPISITMEKDSSALQVATKSSFSVSVATSTDTVYVGDKDPNQGKLKFDGEEEEGSEEE